MMYKAIIKDMFPDRFSIQRLTGPILVFVILSMMIFPLPTMVLDLLFTFNIGISITVLLVTLYTKEALDFSAFPVVLLISTLLRLSLNVASSRIVLLHGHEGPASAGHVIESFGKFLIGGNYTVGIVVFIILTVINFIVITKGAGRIAEVSARFVLDALPGKQMAIDADLNAGLIGEEEAKKRRELIAQEADFFGSMDGASKFVRGDAIAAIMILVINIVGGLVVGIVQHDLDVANAVQIYTLLTIGDGLVAQVPGLIISTSAGLVVSRVSNSQDIGSQIIKQLFNNTHVLLLTASILFIMGILPGMPHLVFIVFAVILFAIALYDWRYKNNRVSSSAKESSDLHDEENRQGEDASWSDVKPVDVLGLEIGYRLIFLVDNHQDGELLRRIKGLRKRFAQEFGYLVPQVHIRDNMLLPSNAYQILIKGIPVAEGVVYPKQFLAIDPGHVSDHLPGREAKDPAFGLPAIWIDEAVVEQAKTLGYTVVDVSTVIATHVNHMITSYASELLGRAEVQSLLENLAKLHPKLVDDVVPKMISVSTLQKILQNLLDESIDIRDIRSILENIADTAVKTQDPEELTASVRYALRRTIMQKISQGRKDIPVMVMHHTLEKILMQGLTGSSPAVEPHLLDHLMEEVKQAVSKCESMNIAAVLVVPSEIRRSLYLLFKRKVSGLFVVAKNEISEEKSVHILFVLGQKAEPTS